MLLSTLSHAPKRRPPGPSGVGAVQVKLAARQLRELSWRRTVSESMIVKSAADKSNLTNIVYIYKVKWYVFAPDK